MFCCHLKIFPVSSAFTRFALPVVKAWPQSILLLSQDLLRILIQVLTTTSVTNPPLRHLRLRISKSEIVELSFVLWLNIVLILVPRVHIQEVEIIDWWGGQVVVRGREIALIPAHQRSSHDQGHVR